MGLAGHLSQYCFLRGKEVPRGRLYVMCNGENEVQRVRVYGTMSHSWKERVGIQPVVCLGSELYEPCPHGCWGERRWEGMSQTMRGMLRLVERGPA